VGWAGEAAQGFGIPHTPSAYSGRASRPIF